MDFGLPVLSGHAGESGKQFGDEVVLAHLPAQRQRLLEHLRGFRRLTQPNQRVAEGGSEGSLCLQVADLLSDFQPILAGFSRCFVLPLLVEKRTQIGEGLGLRLSAAIISEEVQSSIKIPLCARAVPQTRRYSSETSARLPLSLLLTDLAEHRQGLVMIVLSLAEIASEQGHVSEMVETIPLSSEISHLTPDVQGFFDKFLCTVKIS